jgi:ribosome assembly protein 3
VSPSTSPEPEKRKSALKKRRTSTDSPIPKSQSTAKSAKQSSSRVPDADTDDSNSDEDDSTNESSSTSSSSASAESTPETQQQSHASQLDNPPFGQLYLRMLTSELSSDLDAVRRAQDFRDDSSLPLLVRALRQGEGCFGGEEKRRVEVAAAMATAAEDRMEE